MSSQKLSLIIPIYNEASHLKSFLELIDSSDFGLEKELIIVDDCSKDGSQEILKNFAFQSPHVLHFKDRNSGKGSALMTGIELATGDILAVQDADFEYDVRDLPQLIKPILENRADVVFGSRFRKDGNQVHRTFHYLVNRILTLVSNLFSGLYLSDMETCYKIFRAEILKNIVLESERFGFEPEVTAKMARLNLRIKELPISYYPRNYMQGKKITWKDGAAALWHLFKFNFLVNSRKMFKESMPSQYRISGRKWL